MKPEKIRRVRFYSKEDLSSGYNLSFAEPLLNNLDAGKLRDINDIIELYQIKLYFDNDIFLSKWTVEDITRYSTITKDMWGVIANYWIKIDNSNFIELIDELEVGSQPAFWKLNEMFKTHEKLSKDTFDKVLNHPEIWVREIFHHRKIVNYFDDTLKDYLFQNHWTAELLLSEYEVENDNRHKALFSPNCLTANDFDTILLNYLEQDDPNLNYVRLIERSRESSPLKLLPELD